MEKIIKVCRLPKCLSRKIHLAETEKLINSMDSVRRPLDYFELVYSNQFKPDLSMYVENIVNKLKLPLIFFFLILCSTKRYQTMFTAALRNKGRVGGIT